MLTRPLKVKHPGQPEVDGSGQGQPVLGPYGRPLLGEPSSVDVLGHLEQTSTDEETVGQQTAGVIAWAALPTGTPVTATSTVIDLVTGIRYEVIGEPDPKWNPWDKRFEYIRVELGKSTS